jgi:hypothetical protein
MAQSTALRDAAVDLQVVRAFLERYGLGHITVDT